MWCRHCSCCRRYDGAWMESVRLGPLRNSCWLQLLSAPADPPGRRAGGHAGGVLGGTCVQWLLLLLSGCALCALLCFACPCSLGASLTPLMCTCAALAACRPRGPSVHLLPDNERTPLCNNGIRCISALFKQSHHNVYALPCQAVLRVTW
jgi:hypothetical protein